MSFGTNQMREFPYLVPARLYTQHTCIQCIWQFSMLL